MEKYNYKIHSFRSIRPKLDKEREFNQWIKFIGDDDLKDYDVIEVEDSTFKAYYLTKDGWQIPQISLIYKHKKKARKQK
jgi:hypothetical protein